MSKCGKCGSDGHNARTCGKGPSKSTQKRHPKSWVKRLEKKLEAVAESAGDPSEAKPPERSGEPFADLPPLDLPSATTTEAPASDSSEESSSSATDATNSSATTATTSGSGPKTSTDSQIFDTEQLEAMATQLAHDGVMLLGTYAVERGYFALGEPFAKLAGIAAGVLVKVHATKVGISDEEAAAWVLGGVVGVNAVQAGRAFNEERNKKKAEAERERASAAGKQEQQRQQNGVTPAVVAEQRKQAAEHGEQLRTAGPVV